MVSPTGVNGGRIRPPPPKNLVIPAHLEIFYPSTLSPPPTKCLSPPPLSNNFQVITQ